jgi:hypothetical protein
MTAMKREHMSNYGQNLLILHINFLFKKYLLICTTSAKYMYKNTEVQKMSACFLMNINEIIWQIYFTIST